MALMASAESHIVPEEQLDIVHHARVDVYSYGLMLYEIMHGCVFFAGEMPMLVAIKVSRGARPQLALRLEHASLGALIVACWDEHAERRPTMETVVEALCALETAEEEPQQPDDPPDATAV